MNRKKAVCIGLLILMFLFIWGNSMLGSRPSMTLSNKVLSLIREGFAYFGREMPGFINSGNLRKLAHMLEFAGLGALGAMMIPLCKQRWTAVALLGVSVALLDETIQLFSARTSSVKDIWIDLAGFTCGAIAGWFVRRVYRTMAKKENTR